MRAERGFTLIESVMVIAITGVVIAIVAVFIAPATTAYFSSSARAQLGDEADTALRRIGRDLSRALPNSVRVSASALSVELIPVSGAARYATESGNPLKFGVVDAGFDIVGPPLTLSHASQQLAWYNLGAGTPDADAYTLSNVRTSTSAAGNASSVGITGAPLPNPLQAPPFRVYAIEPPVSYRCDLAAGTLTRYSGYGFNAVQPDPPSGGSSAVLARDVTACLFGYDPGAVAARYALVTLQISLSRRGETVSLYHAVHADNLP
ncbi:type II secretion system protein [Roseateles sp.]|uniref:type II secretion system protein n=1 Tax=Roseateles sp. TaxID=1971397 RepID=UPI0025F24DAB|nr:type II secretion system protein [Roseateles sp.]MBV8035716.1 type II secretion system protein [Roseateles sp.]